MTEVDPVIHQPTRLGIMAALVGLEEGSQVEFGFLLDLLGLSDGNLSTHLRKLEEAGFIATEKGFVGRMPRTWIMVTDEGRKAFSGYVAALEGILGTKAPAAASAPPAATARKDPVEVRSGAAPGKPARREAGKRRGGN
jgi:DNA-binding transcriptional ArsR family regulator